ncbi:MAG: tetratricopeptide repeat protein [Acidobacteriota bacterium]|nr:tetratricopeptide repeat protein [Acidobacteriota bacterium]
MSRVVLLLRLRGAAKSEADQRRIEEALRADCRAVLETAPNSEAAGVARDALALIENRQVFPEPRPQCSKEAIAELGSAEELFAVRRFQDSLAHYQKAAERCPDDPVVGTHYADAFFVLGNFAQARSLLEKTLVKNPWHAQAHRFLSDTLERLGLIDAAYHETVLAVLSDPTYEAGWSSLRRKVVSRRGTWMRFAAAKPEVKAEPKQKIEITVTLKEGPDSFAWNMYSVAKAGTWAPPAQGAPVSPRTALEREREAIRTVFAAQKEKGLTASPFWDMMARADRAGFLDESIFVHLLDRDLLAEYRAFCDGSRDRLVRYVETILAPLPPDSK